MEDEGQAGSPVAKAMDQSATSDLVVRFQQSDSLYTAASRISYHPKNELEKYRPSPTLRNSVGGFYDATEVNKLHRAVCYFEAGVPVIIPRYLCFARVFPKQEPTHVHDLLALETIPLLKHIFAPAGLNLPELRRRYEAVKKRIVLDETLTKDVGIQPIEGNTFLFLGKRYLEQCGLPMLYQVVTKLEDEPVQPEGDKAVA